MAITQQSPTGPQLMFLAVLTSTISDEVGASANYVIIYDTADINVGTCYNTGTGTFTVPSTGIYLFQCSLSMQGWTSSHNSINWFQQNNTTSNQSHYWYMGNVNSITNGGSIQLMGQTYQWPSSITSGQNINMHLQVTDGNKVIDLNGSATDSQNWWACYKVT
jgi:hypothetical protein